MLNATQEADLRRLEILLNTLRRGALAVALCEDLALREELMAALRPRLRHSLHEFTLSPENDDPVVLLQDNAEAGDVAVFYDLEKAGPEASGRLEFRREVVWEIGANLLIWVTGEGQRLLLRDAPNFYSRRVLLVHFTGASAEKLFFLVGQGDTQVVNALRPTRGQLVSVTTSEFVMTFRSIGDLFSMAWSIQQAAVTADKVCLGLHYGVAPRQNNEIVGPDLEKARWLSYLGRAGQILFSAELLEIAQQQISNFSSYAHGPIERGTLGRQEVYESVLPGRSPLPLLNAAIPNNLPPRPELHEHRAELEQIAALLAQGKNVALIGEGGTGKTALALETAHGALQTRRFAGGIAFVRAWLVTSYESFRAVLLGAFDIESGDSQQLDERLNAYLRRAPCLVVVNGIDEAPLAEQVWQWISALHSPTQILATSRHEPPEDASFEVIKVTGSSPIWTSTEPFHSPEFYLEFLREHADLNDKANRNWFDSLWPVIYQRALRAAEDKDFELLIRFLNAIGDYCELRGLWKEEERLLNLAVNFSHALGYEDQESTLLNNLANVYRAQRSLDKAEEAYKDSLKLKKRIGERVTEASTLNNLGLIYQQQGRLVEAEETLQEALKIGYDYQDRQLIGRILNNLGNIYFDRQQWADAEKFYRDSLQIVQSMADRCGEGVTFLNLGNLQHALKKKLEAENSYINSLKIRQELGDLVGEGQTLNNLALLWLEESEPEKSLPYAREAVAVLEKTQDVAELAKAREILAQIEADLAEMESGEG